MPDIIIGYGDAGYGDYGYGGQVISGNPVPIVTGGCNPILKDPNGIFWALGCLDDDSGNGVLTTTQINFPLAHYAAPILSTGIRNFSLSAGTDGTIVATQTNLPTIQLPMDYVPLVSTDGSHPYSLTIREPEGLLNLIATPTLLPDFIPYIPDVTMSRWADSVGVFCASCGNSTVTVSADLSCWCCSCNTFIVPEDTNIIVILDE